MRTIAILDDYDNREAWHSALLKKAREKSDADYLIVVMMGDFMEDGSPAGEDKYSRAKRALEEGADLVLEIPVCVGLSDRATKVFSKVALIKRLYAVDNIVIPCRRMSGEALSKLGREAFLRPGGNLAGEGLTDSLNVTAVETVKALYQLYWVLKPLFLDVEELAGNEQNLSQAGLREAVKVPRTSVLTPAQDGLLLEELIRKVGALKEEEWGRMLENTPGGFSRLCESILMKKEALREETGILSLAEKLAALTGETRQKIYLFLLKFLIGITRGNLTICGLHVNCPYSRILGVRDVNNPAFTVLRESSWVPLLMEDSSDVEDFSDMEAAFDMGDSSGADFRDAGHTGRAALGECERRVAALDDRARELSRYLSTPRSLHG